MCNLGIIHWHNKQAEKAVATLKDALQALEARVGKDSTLTAIAMNNLAYVYKEAREYTKAVELAQVGAEHNETIMAKHNLAEAYRASGNEDRAVAIQNEILEMFDVVDDGDAGSSADQQRR
ncbi:hypothetical protein PINS_up024483 [Pythium insidiosum]|nr:hypothetical protein PINS_up024483 [Pythium insidiosum]